MAYKEVKDDNPNEDDNSIIWDPQNEGDFIEGIYVEKEEEVGNFNSNMYHFNSDGQIIKVWGSTVLDGLMKKVGLNSKVMIKYGGIKGKKNKYKTFRVFEDENYKAPSQEPEHEPESEVPDQPLDAEKTDAEAMNQIEHYQNLIQTIKGKDHEPTYWDIRTLAEAEELPAADMERLEKQLARLIVTKKIKKGVKP